MPLNRVVKLRESFLGLMQERGGCEKVVGVEDLALIDCLSDI
jgi:hypothetical protein